MSPARRATLAAAAFSIAGLAGLAFGPASFAAKAPNAIFYAVLVLNTFFSVRFFGAIPPDRDERVIDGVLAVLYVALAATIGEAAWFAAVSVLLFAAAIGKYALLWNVVARRDLLTRKMRIDALGLALCLAAVVGALIEPVSSAWAQAVLFAIANVQLLVIRPMYSDPLAAESKKARQAAPLP